MKDLEHEQKSYDGDSAEMLCFCPDKLQHAAARDFVLNELRERRETIECFSKLIDFWKNRAERVEAKIREACQLAQTESWHPEGFGKSQHFADVILNILASEGE